MILKRIPVLGAIPVKRIFQIPAHLNLNTRLGTRHFRLLINSDRPGTRIVMQNKILILIDRRLQRNFRLQLPKFPPELPILQPGKRWLYGVIVFFPADFLQLDALMERIRTQIRYRPAVIPTISPKRSEPPPQPQWLQFFAVSFSNTPTKSLLYFTTNSQKLVHPVITILPCFQAQCQ